LSYQSVLLYINQRNLE